MTDTPGSVEGREPRDYRLLTRIPIILHTAIKRATAEDKRAASDWIVVTMEAVLAERDREQEQDPEPDKSPSPPVARRRQRPSPKPKSGR